MTPPSMIQFKVEDPALQNAVVIRGKLQERVTRTGLTLEGNADDLVGFGWSAPDYQPKDQNVLRGGLGEERPLFDWNAPALEESPALGLASAGICASLAKSSTAKPVRGTSSQSPLDSWSAIDYKPADYVVSRLDSAPGENDWAW